MQLSVNEAPESEDQSWVENHSKAWKPNFLPGI